MVNKFDSAICQGLDNNLLGNCVINLYMSFGLNTSHLTAPSSPASLAPHVRAALSHHLQSRSAHLSCYHCTPLPSLAVLCRTLQLPTMVHTRGGHRSSTLIRDGTGTSRAAAGHSPAQDTEAPPTLTPDAAMMKSLAFGAILEEFQGAEPPSRRYHTRVGPRPSSPVHPLPPRRAPPS